MKWTFFDDIAVFDDDDFVFDLGPLSPYPIVLRFSSEASLNHRTYVRSAYSPVIFSVEGTLFGKAKESGTSSLIFSTSAFPRGIGRMYPKPSTMVFSSEALALRRSVIFARTVVQFSSESALFGILHLSSKEVYLRFTDYASLFARARGEMKEGSLKFSEQVFIYRSPWQGVSEVGNAVLHNMGENANYNKLPYSLGDRRK